MGVLKIVSDDSDKNRSCSSVHNIHVPSAPAMSNNAVWVARSLEFETQHLIYITPYHHKYTIQQQQQKYKNKGKSYPAADLCITKVVNGWF